MLKILLKNENITSIYRNIKDFETWKTNNSYGQVITPN